MNHFRLGPSLRCNVLQCFSVTPKSEHMFIFSILQMMLKHKHMGATGLLENSRSRRCDLLSCVSDRVRPDSWHVPCYRSSVCQRKMSDSSIIMTDLMPKLALKGAILCHSILPWGFCAVGGLGEVEGWGRGLMAGLSWHGLGVGPFLTSRGEHR